MRTCQDGVENRDNDDLGKDVDLIEKVKESFSLAGEIVLQKYLDEWAEWVDVSPPEIKHKDKIKVVLVEPPHNIRLVTMEIKEVKIIFISLKFIFYTDGIYLIHRLRYLSSIL